MFRLSLVFPTPVGVFPRHGEKNGKAWGLPHARGGVSLSYSDHTPDGVSSPRPWGCFQATALAANQAAVFPTPVGVFLQHMEQPLVYGSLPHARGGVSLSDRLVIPYASSSPRPWGCFPWIDERVFPYTVFPTPVGVFLCTSIWYYKLHSLPHARGGVSDASANFTQLQRSSPRPWGCFKLMTQDNFKTAVFPTPVGVFLFDHLGSGLWIGLPHARGGVSIHYAKYDVSIWSSPRPWGCFLFDASITKT